MLMLEFEERLKVLTPKELECEREKLWNQIDIIRNREQELKIGDYKKYIGRYFKSAEGALHSGYIRIDDIWASKDEVFIEGLYFNSEFLNDYADCNWMSYGAFEQLRYREEPNNWEKFKWIEIDRTEFEYAFAKMLEQAHDSFYKFLNK